MDVVFTPGGTGGTPQPPVAHNDSVSAFKSTPLAIAASTLLANDTDPGGRLPLSVAGISSPINGKVTFSGTTITFTPTTGYAGAASFTYTVKNTANLISIPATVSVTVNVAGTNAASLFAAANTPATITVSDHSAVELGVKFQSSVAGKITGIRFYKSSQNLGIHTAHLWTSTGTSLGTATFTGETASGWQQANFATPVTVQANTV